MSLIQTNSESTNFDWLTPPEIIKALGEFDLDPCCPKVMPWRTAKRMLSHEYTPGIDAPVIPEFRNGLWDDCNERIPFSWHGRVWLNPPFQGAGRWVRKMREHGNGIALLPCATDTAYFHENVWGHASGVMFLRGRLSFYRPDGTKPKNNINRPCCLVAYGTSNLAALTNSGLDGAIVTEMRK